MEKRRYPVYVFFLALCFGVGLLASALTADATRVYTETAIKPPLTPPGWVFGAVWTVLYALMGISGALVYLSPESEQRQRGINLFLVQLAVNFFWSLIFFNAAAYCFAFAWIVLLWGLIIAMVITFYQVKPLAAWLQVPYLLWVTFAAYLNFGVWLLNR